MRGKPNVIFLSCPSVLQSHLIQRLVKEKIIVCQGNGADVAIARFNVNKTTLKKLLAERVF